MSQIDFKFLECCLVHSKYYIDINYFLELWAGGKEMSLFIVMPLGLWVNFCGILFFQALEEHALAILGERDSLSFKLPLCMWSRLCLLSCVGIKTQVVRALRWFPFFLPSPRGSHSISSSSDPFGFPPPLFLALENFPVFHMNSVLHLKDYVLHIHFMFL